MTAIEEVAGEHAAKLAAAEEILAAVAPTLNFKGDNAVADFTIRHCFTEEQLHVFDALGWDRRTLRIEAGRVYRAMHLQALAGTAAERADAEARAERAQKVLDTKGKNLREKIEALQTELAALQHEDEEADKLVAQHKQALENIRKAVPAYIQQRYDRKRREITLYFADLAKHPADEDDREEIRMERDVANAEAEAILDFYVR